MKSTKKSKEIKHENMLRPNPGLQQAGYRYYPFLCRGCTIGQYRLNTWRGFISSISGPMDRQIDNSYLSLVEEPGNPYDPNAIRVVCRGEFFGTVGYVDREFTAKVKEILDECISYRVDMVDENEVGQKNVHLILTWKQGMETGKAENDRGLKDEKASVLSDSLFGILTACSDMKDEEFDEVIEVIRMERMKRHLQER